jgi:tetratricopeptide (TPR) repeat protein
MEQLPDNYPHPLVRRWRLADFSTDLAIVLSEKGQWDEASAHFGNAIRLLTSPPSLFQDEEIRMFASQTLIRSTRLFIRGSAAHGKSDAARKTLKEISKTLWARNDAGMALTLAIAYVKEGLLSEAVSEAETAAASGTTAAVDLYDAACVVSLASAVAKDAKVQERHAKRAVELLVLATKAGFNKAAHMKKDADLDPLRGRDDFKKLIAEMEKAAEKNPPPKGKS